MGPFFRKGTEKQSTRQKDETVENHLGLSEFFVLSPKTDAFFVIQRRGSRDESQEIEACFTLLEPRSFHPQSH